MGRKHEKARGKDKRDMNSDQENGKPKIYGCPIPEPVTCSFGSRLKGAKDGCGEVVLMECTNSCCPFAGQTVHSECFRVYEDHLVKLMSNIGSARGWTDSQRRSNLWEKKGQALVAKVCRCRCGAGTTRRDEVAVFQQKQKRRQQVDVDGPAHPKKKTAKTKALPTLNFGKVKGPTHAFEEKEARTGRGARKTSYSKRDVSCSSVGSDETRMDEYHLENRNAPLSYVTNFVATQNKKMVEAAVKAVDYVEPVEIEKVNHYRTGDAVEMKDVVPEPGPPRSYATAMKMFYQTGDPFDDDVIHQNTDVFFADSGVETKSSTTTGSEETVDRDFLSPCFVAQEQHAIQENDEIWKSKTSQQADFVDAHVSFPPGLNVPHTGSPAWMINRPEPSDRLIEIPVWDVFSGTTLGLGECLLAQSFLPGFFY